MIIIRYLSDILRGLEPDHAQDYTRREHKLLADLQHLDMELAAQFSSLHAQPFFVLHDAFQYLERRYDLRAVRAIYALPNNSPSVAHMHALRDSLQANQVQCVFKEPQLPSAFIAPLIEGFPITIGTLDPLGADLSAGPDAYFQLMRNIATDFNACFTPLPPK